jgi:Chitobiase/beta-hexosaminidase C-terminal domain
MTTTTIPGLPEDPSELTGDEMVPVAPVGGAPMARVSTAQIADLANAKPLVGPTGPAGLGQISLTSPNGTINVGGSPGSVLTVVAGTKLLGAENILPGTYLYANLPAASTYPNMYASTRDQGAVFSNGNTWQILYNSVTGTLRVATGTPLAPATQNTAYSLQLTSTQGVGTVTWILVADIAHTNSWAVSSAGLLTGTPTAIETDLLVIQATDSTGSVAQKFVTIATVASQTPAATPTFSPSAGTYTSVQTVTISDSTPSATIYYTTNGSTPSTSSPVYSGPFVVSATTTVQAIATAPGFTQSSVGSATYTIQLPAATPTFSPVAGTYTVTQTVTISTSTPSATIYYTTNGTTPTTGSPVYTGPITVSATETIKAIATAAGYSQSAVGSALYTIAPLAATPTFSPAGGTYSVAQTVTISTTTPGATIYYTTNGSAPTTGSPVYSSPITVSASETVNAIATAPGFTQSAMGSATYTIGGSGTTFDFYVSTTGSDANAGTLAAPWAITSFQNTSSNQSKMKGKRIGIIAGTYSTGGLTSSTPSDFTASLITIPAGTSSASTYVGSSNSSGFYTPRVAIISVAQPTTAANGQIGGPGGQTSGNSSYITIDGITINGNNLQYGSSSGNCHLIQMYGVYNASTSSDASETGILVQNCEIYGILTTTHPGGNSALVFFEGVHSSFVQNNYLHDASSTNATDLGHVHAGEEYGCYNNQWIYNTIANCCSGIEAKNSCTGTVVAYNYMYNIGAPVGNTASALAFEGFDGYAAGATTTGPAPINYLLHHNILDGCCGVSIGDQTFDQLIPINIYNNTVYDTTTGSNLGWHHNTNGLTNILSYYNNIYVATVGTGGGSSSAKLTTGSAAGNALLDYNCYYQGSGTYTNFWSNFSTAESNFAAWKTLMGQEAHSFVGNPTFATAYSAGNGPVQFQLGSGSPCLSTGQSGDNIGAWDTGTTQVGAAWCLTSGTYPITPNSNNGSGA